MSEKCGDILIVLGLQLGASTTLDNLGIIKILLL